MNKYLKQLLDALAKKNAEIQTLMTKSLDAGSTPDEETESEIAKLEDEVAAIEKNIERVKKQIAAAEQAANTATPVAGENEEQAAASAAGEDDPTKPKTKIEIVKLAKGIGFAQYARAKLVSALNARKGIYKPIVEVAKEMGFNDEVCDLITKATLGTTTDVGFASALVHENHLVGEFVELLRVATVFDKLTGFRAVPFNSTIPSQTGGGSAQWVGEGARKPLTNPTYGEVKVGEHKLAAITVYTQELMRRSDPAVDVLVRDDLIEASKTLIDATFLGAQTQTDVTPVGMLNNVAAIPATGVTAAAYDKDLQDLEDAFIEANLSLDGAVYLMSETRASRMSKLRDPLGNRYYPGLRSKDKDLDGRDVITSQSVGDKIVLLKTSEILLAQDGGVDVSYSDQATLVDGAVTHHLWQENKFAVRVEKFISWNKRRPVAAGWIDYSNLP